VQESWGLAGSKGTCCWVPPSSQDLPSTPREGEAVREGFRVWASRTAPPLACGEGLPPPSLGIGGRAAGSMAGGGADPLSKGGEGGLYTTGVSCRLTTGVSCRLTRGLAAD
jgi:hypothetical protein